jgi:hypothetical protein
MAKYRIFPIQDAFISTERSTANTGRDELLEVGGYPTSDSGQTLRSLIKFDEAEIKQVLEDKAGVSYPIDETLTPPFKAKLNLALNYANELPINYTLKVHPIAETWDEGTGKFGDIPINKSGCSWKNRLAGTNHPWATVSQQITTASELGFTLNTNELHTTSSFEAALTGGGSWYFTSGSAPTVLSGSQSFNKNSSHDLDVDVTNATVYMTNGYLNNNGFIVKAEDSIEFNETSTVRLKYYGEDTNTIYPPFLELQWNDYSHSSTLQEVTTPDVVVSVKNNKGKYVDEGKQRFRLHVRPENPVRSFTTGSAYTVNHTLPTGSFWGLKDENTEEMVFDYDEYTKINADNISNYFDVYMDGLQPERYYRILIKTEIDGTTTVVDNNQVFKVVRNG